MTMYKMFCKTCGQHESNAYVLEKLDQENLELRQIIASIINAKNEKELVRLMDDAETYLQGEL